MARQFVALVFFCLVANSSAADLTNGVIAHAMGRYTDAFGIMLPLAEGSDDHLAQYYVGYMYELGQGVEQDHEAAVKWFRRAAEQGVPQAQYRLAKSYKHGQGVGADPSYAYAWYSVAAASSHAQAQQAMTDTGDTLGPEAMEEAKKLSAEYISRYKKSDDDTEQ